MTMTEKSEAEVEQDIRAKELNAPRVVPADVDAEIFAEQYHVFPNTTVTVCCLTMRNGFTVVGESAAASPENFDEDVGRQVAFNAARQKIWPLLGFRLKDHLSGRRS